jgi:tetratricopeptide (TPR) repeat protein
MKKIILILVVGLFFVDISYADTNVNDEIKHIRFEVTNIAHSNLDKKQAYDLLLAKADNLIKEFPENDSFKIWKATILSSQAKFLGLSALSNVKEARKILEKAVANDKLKTNATAYYMLGILYYKAPAWPVAFGNDKTSKKYFMEALKIEDNMDTNFRYGEFLINQGETKEALKYLEKALSFQNRKDRKEDELKRKDINNLISEIK